MDNNSNPGNKTIGKQLPKIENLLSAPLVAAASANSVMIKEQTRFLMDTCFVAKGDNQYEPVMIKMSIARTIISEGKNGEVKSEDITSTFKIPLLTLVPINSLVVDNVDVDFSLEIVSYSDNQANASRKENEQQKLSDNLLNDNASEKGAVLSGKLSYDANDKGANRGHNASKLNVKIHAGTIPLPTGVTALIDLYVKSINAVPEKTKE